MISITDIQVRYWDLQEKKRNNRATEAENYRSHVAQETETSTHNRAQEALGMMQLAEASRHNLASEGISRDSLNESRRHNRATENMSYAQLQETRRVNNANIANVNAKTEGQKLINRSNAVKANKDEKLAGIDLVTTGANMIIEPISGVVGIVDDIVGMVNPLKKIFKS